MPNDKEFELDDLESFSFDDLSLDEAPAAGSESGEDPFGVWVKSAPEDRDAVPPEAETEAEALPEADSLPEEDFLSTEELANLDDSFEFVTVEEPLTGETPMESALEDEVAFLDTPEAIEAEKADSTALPTFDEISLDDFVTFDEVSPEAAAARTDAPSDAQGADNFDEEFLDIDIELDDLGDNLEAVEAAPLPSAIEGATEDIGLDEFGDFEEVSPLAATPGSDSLLDDLPEMASLDEDPFLGDDGGFFEEEVFEEPGATLVDEGPVSLDLEPDDHTDLDHIMALEEHLTSGIRESDAPAEAPLEADTGSDVAARLLGKIEQELSSIKQEISDLKREVTHLRAPGNARPAEPALAATQAPAPELDVVEEAPAKAHGFFDEEDDETISLTDDELDNILSTAEVSEGEEAGVNLDEDLLGLDAEGNLVEPPAEHLTDEEFLAGTALADDEPLGGVPESIELEDALPDELDVGETEDLFAGSEDGLELDPLPEGLLEGNPPPLELPSDDDLGLELADTGALTPDLIDDDVSFTEELSFENLDTELPADDGWSPPPAEATPPPPPVTLPAAPAAAPGPNSSANSSMSPGLKDELRAVLSYMDKLLASLPDDKIQEFAESEHFEVYKRLFEELGLIE